jgi:hypothetical protein
VATSNLRSQVTAEQVLASPENDTVQTAPSQLAAAETVVAETTVQEPSVRERAATEFTARWFDLPKSVDLDAREFAAPRKAAEHTTPDSNEQMPSTRFVAADTGGGLRHNPAGTANFGSIFLAGALGILLFGGVLRLTRAWHDCPWQARTANDLAYEPEMSLAELMRVLQRTDEALKSPQAQVTEILTKRRTSNLGPRSAPGSLGRDRITGGLRDIRLPPLIRFSYKIRDDEYEGRADRSQAAFKGRSFRLHPNHSLKNFNAPLKNLIKRFADGVDASRTNIEAQSRAS